MKTLKSSTLILVTCLSLFVCGCGTGKYEARLQNSVKYFDYLDQLNQNLSQRSSFQNGAISYRAPLQFSPLQAPLPGDFDKDGNLLPGKADLRQPIFIPGLTFEGLEAAWITNFPAAGDKSFPGYLFLVTNRNFYLDDDRKERALEFSNKTIADIGSTLQTATPDQLDWIKQTVPENASYSKPVHYKMISLAAQKPVLGPTTNVRIYRHDTGEMKDGQGEIQTLLIFVLPRAYESGAKTPPDDLLNRIDKSLETLLVDSQKPVRGAMGAGGGAPGGSTGGF